MPINSSSIPALRAARSAKRRRRAGGGGVFDFSGVGGAMPEAMGADVPVRDLALTVPKAMLYDLPKQAIDQAAENPLPGLRREDFSDVPADTSPDERSPLGWAGVKVPRVGWQPVDPMVGSSLEAGMNVMGGTALSAPAGAAGAGPSLRSAVRHGERVYKAEPGQTHMDALRLVPEDQRVNADLWADRGFIDHRGRFLDREKAQKYAVDNGLLNHPKMSPWALTSRELISEELPDVIEKNGRGIMGAGPADKRAAGVAATDDIDRVLDAERRLAGASNGPRPADPVPAGAASAPDPAAVGPGGGGASGAGSLSEAQATAARWAGERKPLEGLPGALKIGDSHFVPGPIGKIHDVAEDYMRTHRPEIAYAPPTRYYPIDPEHSKAIAQAYEEMKHTPKDKATIASYNALIDETAKQYEAIKKTGLKIEPIPAGSPDPYAANPRMAAIDVAENNHLWFFPTEGGFGTLNKISNNPMLRKTGERIGNHELLANDMFRVVHDYFGHLKQGHGFRAAGEDNAWRSHSAMYSDLARPAMTTETRGQNSWVNYGPHGEKNRTASGANTVYADQKVGLMPDWTMYDRGKEPIYAYHGSEHDFNKFSSAYIDSGEGAQAYGQGLYFAENPKVAKAYRDQLAGGGRFERDGQPMQWHQVADDLLGQIKAAGGGDYSGSLVHQITSKMEAGKSLKQIRRSFEPPLGTEDAWKAGLKAAEAYTYNKTPGHTYKVAIEADKDKFLDWDKPFTDQPHILSALEKAGYKQAPWPYKGWVAPGPDGKMLTTGHVDALLRSGGRRGEAEKMLSKAGVPGIKYFDQGSRNIAQGAKSQNFVTFNDDTIRILRKYGVVGIPAAGVLGADGEERRARGGRVARRLARKQRASGGEVTADDMIARANRELETQPERRVLPDVGEPMVGDGGDFTVGTNVGRKAADIASRVLYGAGEGLVTLPRRAIENSQFSLDSGHYDPSTSFEAATLPMGTGAIAGVPVKGLEAVMGAGPVRRIADDTGAAMRTARDVKRQYAEPEYNAHGNLIYNKGVENPPNRAVQTVADPYRMMFPGVYRNPRIIAEEAAARVGPEDPAMKRLFGVTRDDLREMAKGRVGNEDPNLRLAKNPKGSLAAQNIQTPQNTQRLQDILGEAGRHEGLRTADAWYIMDPVYQRMEQMFGPEEAVKRYKMFNTSTAMASPGSDVMTEIQRGTGAHWLHNQGRFDDFKKFAGVPEELRSRTAHFPQDMRYIGGHPYHRTAQSDPMQKFFDTGAIQSDAPKVPLYAHASGVPETGFQTSGPVGDAHFSRGVGLSDTRKGPTDVQGSFSRAEYQTLQPWWQHDVAAPAGLESVPAQARLWTVLGPQTGVESALGAPKLELLAQQIMVAAKRLRISPEQARDLILSGQAGAGMLGGAIAAPVVADAMRERASGGGVNSAMDVARRIKRAKGGAVHVGPIMGDTDGRADEVPMEVPDGAYVLTADHCSAMGEGNTLAGFKKLNDMFPMSAKAHTDRKPVKRASGGRVPIYAADGEYVICPEDIINRWGDLDEGHRILDAWQTSERKEHVNTLRNLAPPAQD